MSEFFELELRGCLQLYDFLFLCGNISVWAVWRLKSDIGSLIHSAVIYCWLYPLRCGLFLEKFGHCLQLLQVLIYAILAWLLWWGRRRSHRLDLEHFTNFLLARDHHQRRISGFLMRGRAWCGVVRLATDRRSLVSVHRSHSCVAISGRGLCRLDTADSTTLRLSAAYPQHCLSLTLSFFISLRAQWTRCYVPTDGIALDDQGSLAWKVRGMLLHCGLLADFWRALARKLILLDLTLVGNLLQRTSRLLQRHRVFAPEWVTLVLYFIRK